jgi:hypothetical protein
MSDESTEKPETPETAAHADEPKTEEPAAHAAGEAEAEPEDQMSPEAIAKRVAALGDEDQLEKIAREEEIKLAERRAKTKGGKKRGLEAAASKRLAQIGGGKVPPKRVAVAADVDPLLARTGQLGKWIRANQSVVTGLAIAAIVAVAGAGGYAWWTQKVETEASQVLTQAVLDEAGRIGDPDKAEDEDRKDPRPVFKTEADRREAALTKYREVQTKYKGTGAAFLARLEEGSLLLDKGDLDGAQAAFNDASSSPLASADAEVKGRAIEGLGFVAERRAAAKPEEKDKWLDEAATQFRALENTDVKGFKELGMYHQARVAEAKGDKDKAVQLLKSLHERLNAPGESHPFPYLETVADDRLRNLSPDALPPKPRGGPMGMPGRGGPPGMGGMGGPGGQPQMSDEQMQRIIEQLKKQAEQQGGGAPLAPIPVPPPAPAPK